MQALEIRQGARVVILLEIHKSKIQKDTLLPRTQSESLFVNSNRLCVPQGSRVHHSQVSHRVDVARLKLEHTAKTGLRGRIVTSRQRLRSSFKDLLRSLGSASCAEN